MEQEKIRALLKPDSGCELCDSFGAHVSAFIDLCTQTHDICDGCAFNPCKFIERSVMEERQRRAENFGKVNFETNAQIAERLGISKRQAAKMRKRGEI
jgi:hypothetical protein